MARASLATRVVCPPMPGMVASVAMVRTSRVWEKNDFCSARLRALSMTPAAKPASFVSRS